jgi:hypothetical protein
MAKSDLAVGFEEVAQIGLTDAVMADVAIIIGWHACPIEY